MPHIFIVDCSLVFRTALSLKIKGCKGIDKFVYSSLEQQILRLKAFEQLTHLIHSLQRHPNGPWYYPIVVYERVAVELFVLGVARSRAIGLPLQPYPRQDPTQHFAYLLQIRRIFRQVSQGWG